MIVAEAVEVLQNVETEDIVSNVNVDITSEGFELCCELTAIFEELKNRGITYDAVIGSLNEAYGITNNYS